MLALLAVLIFAIVNSLFNSIVGEQLYLLLYVKSIVTRGVFSVYCKLTTTFFNKLTTNCPPNNLKKFRLLPRLLVTI